MIKFQNNFASKRPKRMHFQEIPNANNLKNINLYFSFLKKIYGWLKNF